MERPDVLDLFAEPTRSWFRSAFPAPTASQVATWEAVAQGRNVLTVAPTGSGKTLAGFLWCIDRLAQSPRPGKDARLRVLYVSPLKALAADIERNLKAPLVGITAAARRLGTEVLDLEAGVRTGETPPEERRRFSSAPPDILITTPESLYLLLTSRAREALKSVETVIVDEVHSVAGNKRGAHLALSLERLDHLVGAPVRRLGLSATVRPAEEVARFLGGSHPVTVVDPGGDKRFEIKVVVPVEDLTALDLVEPRSETEETEARAGIWPHLEDKLLELVRSHRTTIVFANSRRLAERLCARLNLLAGGEVARAHHGSVSREERVRIEDDLKAGRIPAVVATSSLELGIDMAAVDLVVQVEAPGSVASGLQRIGRSGHRVGDTSRGIIFPKFRGDLLESTVVVERMKERKIEALSYPRNPLDVLAQQIVAMVAMQDWEVDELFDVIRGAAPFAELPRGAFEGVLDMLAGRYPSSEFGELRPRLNWDRLTDRLSARPGAQRVAVTSGGTIPDRGLFGVFMVGEPPTRVGELDEEMVYETRPGDVFVLGASSWLIEDISHDRVLVSPAPGRPGRMPFWHGDAPGRPVELGRATGAFVRELASLDPQTKTVRLEAIGLDAFASANLIAYLDEQRDATGALPDDRTLVVERFRDQLGDWRLCVHSPFGARINAPWAQAIEARLQHEKGLDSQCIYTDDGIVVSLPDADEPPTAELVCFEPESVEELVTANLGHSALFAGRFRECASRALLLPRRRPGTRTPLWQQRRRSAHLLQVARRHASFPIVLEAYRECLSDVFDMPELKRLMADMRARKVRVVEVETDFPSPFASSLQFGYVSAFMYEGDAPLAERRAQALSLDRSLLAEIMGAEELRELIDAAALADMELELQWLTERRRAGDADGIHDMLRALGDLSTAEVTARAQQEVGALHDLARLEEERRAVRVRIAGQERWIAAEDASRYRDALGVALPVGLPSVFLEPVEDPLGQLLARYAATHGPFPSAEPALRFGIGVAPAADALARLEAQGRVISGEFRPDGRGREWIDAEVLRGLRRRSLAAFRREVEPTSPQALARFGVAWHGLDRPRAATPEALLEVLEQLQGVPVPASALESQVLPARLSGYQPGLLDQLGATGEILWCGAGAIGADDGWMCLALSDAAPTLLPDPSRDDLSDDARAVHAALSGGGALFFRGLAEATGIADDARLLLALWELVWAGHVTNDTFAALRALLSGGISVRRRGRRGRPALPARRGPPTGAGRWSLLPERTAAATPRLSARTQQMLARHGLLTRGTVGAERSPGGFAAVYPVLKAMEESGRCRRGYFVEGLGGAQFAMPGAVDRLRGLPDEAPGGRRALVLAATDPANPYGASLPWPEREGHRPGRKPKASVVLVDGRLVLYLEKGGRTLLTFTDDADDLQPAAAALADAARAGSLGRLALERADGADVLDSALSEALVQAGFRASARGLRLRA